MSYEPTTWANGDIITAVKLNNIESGVQSVSSSYTPTTWVNGDIITATKLNNIEQGIANASGGSSDFSTATMTVINTVENSNANLTGVFIDTRFDKLVPNYGCGYGTTTVTVALYKGDAIGGIDAEEITSTTGDITLEDFDYTVSGDCTVTVKGYPWE